jgi:hypothetical protein
LPLVPAALVTVACVLAPVAFAASPLYWSYPSVIDSTQIDSISCPSSSLCVGVDHVGDVVTSTDPTGGPSAWAAVKVDNEPEAPYTEPNALNDVSCPQPAGSLCVAVGEGGIFTSSDPTGGANAWAQAGGVGAGGHAVSCPSTSLCVVGAGTGEIVTSTDPSGGASAWSTAQVDRGNSVLGLSCPSESLCIGVDDAGNVVTSNDPAGGAGAWTVTHIAAGGFSGVSCPSISLCVAVGGHTVMSSTDPTGGATAWLSQWTDPDGNSLDRVACASESLCIASGSSGEIVESSDPIGGAGSWTTTKEVDGTEGIAGISCASESLCFATDEAVLIGIPAHTLSVSVVGAGQGTVTSSPIACPFGCTYSGPACPRNCAGRSSGGYVPQRLSEIACIENGWFGRSDWGTCALSFPAQNVVALTATPEPGSIFTGWGGACEGSGGCNLAMNADRTASAFFAPAPSAPSVTLAAHQSSTTSTLGAPLLTGVSQTHSRWREPGGRSHIDAKQKNLPIGTTFYFTLDEPASVTLSFTVEAKGRSDDRKAVEPCVVLPKATKRGRRCTGTVVVGELTLLAHSGKNEVGFAGEMSEQKKLKPGNYTVRLTATASAKSSTQSVLHFIIAS